MNRGIVFNIQKFSIHDGPGVRTTVFLKGCPLKCKWCANPESQSEKIQILWDRSKCTGCSTCVHTCQEQAVAISTQKDSIKNPVEVTIDTRKCAGCLQCVNSCPSGALSFEGESMSVKDVIDECLKDIAFYETSGGGVTISGGEGMSQPEFLKELLAGLKQYNIHLAIETTGYIKKEVFRELAPMFDLLLFDVKHYDSGRHYEGTCVYNELIVDNLKWAVAQGIEVLVRIPVIPGFNASLEDAAGIALLLKQVGASRVQLLPFHQFGENKYQKLGLAYAYENIAALHEEDLQDYQQIFRGQGIEAFF